MHTLKMLRFRFQMFRLDTQSNVEKRRDAKTILICFALILIAAMAATVIAQAR